MCYWHCASQLWSKKNSFQFQAMSSKCQFFGSNTRRTHSARPLCSVLQPRPPFAAKPPVTQLIPTLRWPMSTHAGWLESLMFSRIPLGVQKTVLHGGGVNSCGTYDHQSGQQVTPPLRLLQTLRVGGAAGGQHSHGCFLLIQSTKI